MNNKPMLNAYPNSIGNDLGDCVEFLKCQEMQNTFSSFYLLPSFFNSDLDRGFSIIDYSLNEQYVSPGDLEGLKELDIELKLDFVLNHLSVLSPQFQDILTNGLESQFSDFFINWNKFWEGYGTMTDGGYILPQKDYLDKMFFRKPGLPILMIVLPDKTEIPYWNTFYQDVKYDQFDAQDLMKAAKMQYSSAVEVSEIINLAIENEQSIDKVDFGKYSKYKSDLICFMKRRRKYLGQMDLNITSPLVWDYYDVTLGKLSQYGANIVRLDAFAYAPKSPGKRNFLNEPETWELLEKVQKLADKYDLTLLPEIHSSYIDKTYEILAEKGYITYDFFLPGLIIDGIERHTPEMISRWAKEVLEKKIKTINMLGCHDGIPLLDLEGLISKQQIESLITIIVERGGFVKNLHGKKNMYYQVNATYYSALGEDDRKMMFARALQLFMPGKPQIWYLDLLMGKNDYGAFDKAGENGHKEINRSNIALDKAKSLLQNKNIGKQLEMIRFRNTFDAFDFESDIELCQIGGKLRITWLYSGLKAVANLDFANYDFDITGFDKNTTTIFRICS